MFEDFRPNLNKTNWVAPPFEPEIDLNFLGLNTKIIIKTTGNKNDESL
jgi:hypothetical protein